VTGDPELEKLTPSDADEAVTLEIAWARGSLDRHVERLLAFVDRNHDEIVQLAEERSRAPERASANEPSKPSPVNSARPAEMHPPNAAALLDAVKCVVGRAGAVHLASEMRDQLQVIRDELWIRGERGDYDRAYITEEWTSRHAANWRRWRLKEYAFVIDRIAERVLARIASGQRPTSGRSAGERPRD
jgi:hypothetical protein